GHGVASSVQRGLLHAGRDRRTLLALRRHRLDFPVPAAVSHRRPLQGVIRTMAEGQGHFGHAHIAPATMYYKVFGALIIGTILTVAAAKVDMGPLHNVVMRTRPRTKGPLDNVVLLTIAFTKATLVILFFMHVRWSSRLTWVVAGAGFFWLLLLFT